MKYPFTIQTAKNCIKAHNKVLSKIIELKNNVNKYEQSISSISNKLLEYKLKDQLQNISVDELNRNKNGFRIKLLKSRGFNSIYDLYKSSEYSLAKIKGISEYTAYQIMSIVRQIAQDTKEEVKISLTLDDENHLTKQLIDQLAKYIKVRTKILEYTSISEKLKIEENISILKKGIGFFSRLFASKQTINKTIEAFNYLDSLLESEYGKGSLEFIKELISIDNMNQDSTEKDFTKDPIKFVTTLEELEPGLVSKSSTNYGLPDEIADEVQNQCFYPDGLLCSLRRYQEWGVKFILHQGKVLLGDEMGLGKTVQAIATMVSLRNVGGTHFLVVCPASVLTNWCREIQKLSTLCAIKIHGRNRNLSIEHWVKNGGVAVTTYETTEHFNLNHKYKIDLVVVDEAHYIKNPDANRSINVREICTKADRLLFMTGTAMENKVEEMIELISVLQPKIARQISGMTYISTANQFRKLVAPVYYRRKREDVLTELPELIENVEWCSMFSKEESVYEECVLNKDYSGARRVSWNLKDLSESSKANRLLEIIEEAKSEGRKVIIFSYFLDTINKIHELLNGRCSHPINGSVSPQRRQEIIDEFNLAPPGEALLAQIIAGGTGLNIQSASVVILCEPQFKPSIENQAISRAYRMGQTRNVLVYRLLCENTIEEKIMRTLEEKQLLFDKFADKSEAAKEMIEMDNKTFGNIISEEIERIKNKREGESKL